MITPSLVLSSARELAAHNGTFSEHRDRLDVTGFFESVTLQRWRTIATEIEGSGIGELTALDALGDRVDLKVVNQPAPEGEVRLIIKKRNTATTFYFFSAEGLPDLLDAEGIAVVRRILVAADFTSFSTVSCRFEPWTSMVEDDSSPNRLSGVVPRRFVKDLIGGRVPLAIGPFLLSDDIPAQSAVFDIWRRSAVKQLLFSLVNEVLTENGTEKISLLGPRLRRLGAGLEDIDISAALGPATEAARWVYDSGRDIDVRHKLFTHELAREWPEDISWAHGFIGRAPWALDSAKTTFQAYVLETSKDTLKALGDLRAALSEEVGKVTQQTRELLSTLWRDFIIAVTALLARIALVLADKPAGNSIAIRAMLLGTAIFIGASLTLTLSSNARFMKVADESRTVWRTKLYGFLPKADLQALSDGPLERTTKVYHRVKWGVILLYVIVILALLVTAAWPSSTK